MGDIVPSLPPIQIVAFLLSYVGGVLMNYVIKTKREGLNWKEYWTSNPISSIAAVFVSTGMFIGMLTAGQTDHLTYFSLAFTVENLINTQTTKATKKEEQE
ncbi:hypothetical protein HOT49_gp076 [Erwinia phage vB_EamM_Alexandra]|uniref:Uncharacterized protein n=1 Tax=Erwinia phage vB_EamM_Alexandra TaxID=2201424 RepID=A0A2Z4QEK9_9CAUD|nr:hypothetical protein HOT49_gp076 [Erwinia phage vB_EamM_Alexandra]AWY08354.1 hypothetical protein Alexandra_76 [Erwinia phage vB_EamM_Alexandra]